MRIVPVAPSPTEPVIAPTSPSRPTDLTIPDERPPAPRMAFGRWLLAQQERAEGVGALAAAARTDPGFPRNGTANEVRARLMRLGADGDAFEQVDEAECSWRNS